jgi:hypothetical protein
MCVNVSSGEEGQIVGIYTQVMCTYTCASMKLYMYVCMCVYIYICICKYVYINIYYMHVCECIVRRRETNEIYTQVMHTYIHKNIHTYRWQARQGVYIPVYHQYMHTCIHKHTHAYVRQGKAYTFQSTINTCIHAYINTHMHMSGKARRIHSRLLSVQKCSV